MCVMLPSREGVVLLSREGMMLLGHLRDCCVRSLLCAWLSCAGVKTDLKLSGLFYGIGHKPNNKLFSQWIETDDKGYVKV